MSVSPPSDELDYQHKPLPSDRSIRVLHLQPAQDLTASIKCRLEAVSLDQRPKYWALSYAWEDQIPTKPTYILPSSHNIHDAHSPNFVLKVTANCLAAIQRLRHTIEERTLWIDSICIDQTSLAEKSTQIALMPEIFREAERVVVWLGEGDDKTTQCIRLLSRIGDLDRFSVWMQNMLETPENLESVMSLHCRYTRAIVEEEGCTPLDDDNISIIFHRSWFTRIWTLQEVVFPRYDKIQVYCGNATMTWGSLTTATDSLRQLETWSGWQSHLRIHSFLSLMMDAHRDPSTRRYLERNRPGDLAGLQAWGVMARCRKREASDPKDKALALYGLFSELGMILPRPDYTKSVGDIYADTTASCIEYDKSLLILYEVPSDRRRPGLPSWVPDWSDKGWDHLDFRYPKWRLPFAASGSSDPKWEFSHNRRQLTVYGKIIDTIIHRTSSYSSGSIPGRRYQDVRYNRLEFGSSLAHRAHVVYQSYKVLKEWVDVSYWAETYPTGESVEEVLQRTLIDDSLKMLGRGITVHGFENWLGAVRMSEGQLIHSVWPDFPSPDSSDLSSRRAWQALYAFMRETAALQWQDYGLVDENGPMIDPRMALVIDALKQRDTHGFHDTAMYSCDRKTFFRTKDQFLGTAPDRMTEEVEIGDCIAIVAGLNLPVILRPDGGGGFRLITHCYVHGIMYGEAWERIGDHLDKIVLI